MKLTKVFYGNQYVDKFMCDGRRYSKWQIFKARVRMFFIKLIRITVIVGILAGSLYGSFKAGQNLFPNTVYAEKEVKIEVESDIPILEKICQAESGGKQFKLNGDVIRGKVNPSDIGYCQINERIWNDKARKLGYDIFTLEGNKAMARWIFVRYGSEPWNSSKSMWNK